MTGRSYNFSEVSLVLMLLACTISWANGKLIMTNIHLEGDPEYVKVAATLKNVNGRALVSGDGYLLNDINGDVMISGVISVSSNGHYTPLVRIEPLSLCKYLNGKKKHPVFKFIFKMIQQYGKIPTSCPIKKGHYYVNDFEIDDGLVPAMAPPGNYRVNMQAAITNEKDMQKVIYKSVAHFTIEQEGDEETSESAEE